jgi:hypothetical protein
MKSITTESTENTEPNGVSTNPNITPSSETL